MLGSYLAAAQLAASQEGLSSMSEYVSKNVEIQLNELLFPFHPY
jgi:hypothetical protein